MFDGNHRTSRRTISLGGKSAIRSRKTAIEIARRQREERQAFLKRNNSAIKIQRCRRGFYSRKKLGCELRVGCYFESKMLSLSMRLSKELIRFGRGSRVEILEELMRLRSYSGDISDVGRRRIGEEVLIHLRPPVNEYTEGLKDLIRRLFHGKEQGTAVLGSVLYVRLFEWLQAKENNETSLVLLDMVELCPECSAAILCIEDLINHPLYAIIIGKVSLDGMLKELFSMSEEVRNMIRGKEMDLLRNCMELCNSSNTCSKNLIPLLQFCFLEREDLTVWTGMIGFGLDWVSANSMDSDQSRKGEKEEMEEDSDLEYDESDESKKQHKREEYLTIPQLSQMYTSKIVQRRQQTPSCDNPADRKLVEILGKSPFFRDLGVIVFASSDDRLKEQYCYVLSQILRHGTSEMVGGNHYSLSPLLSSLAFSSTNNQNIIISGLWSILSCPFPKPKTFHPSFLSAAICYSDILSHLLLAMDDEEFLHLFQTDASLKVKFWTSCLEEMYDTHPLLVSSLDTQDGQQRLAFFLKATRLYHSLYRRFTRIPNDRKFCQETDWHFQNPKLVTLNSESSISEVNENNPLGISFRDPKTARILTSIPQSIPFFIRVRLFSSLLTADKHSRSSNAQTPLSQVRTWDDLEQLVGKTSRLTIRRDRLYHDAFDTMGDMTNSEMRGKVQITFVNEYGTEEAGIDGGGVFKEFLNDLILDSLDKNGSLFEIVSMELQTLSVKERSGTDTTELQSLLPHYEFLGRILGKAVYESILIEPQFSLPFLNQILGIQNSLDDLKNLDPEFHSNLHKLRNLSQLELQSLQLCFECPMRDGGNSVELVKGGSKVQVTQDNVTQYLHLVSHFKLNVISERQTRAFLRGFRTLIPLHWTRLFSSPELSRFISGNDDNNGFSIADLKKVMRYSGGYHISQPYMQSFWEVLDGFNGKQKSQFLKFMTSCSRQPV